MKKIKRLKKVIEWKSEEKMELFVGIFVVVICTYISLLVLDFPRETFWDGISMSILCVLVFMFFIAGLYKIYCSIDKREVFYEEVKE